MKTIYLIGFMGSGKSTVGKELSEELKTQFYDTDQVIEKKYAKKIKNIFRDYGEETFRDYETNVLKLLPAIDCVVSTGGGIIERRENIDFMQNGIIVFLHTSFDEIKKRLANDESRPLWNNQIKEKLDLFKRRADCYKSCTDFTVFTDNLSIEQIVSQIIDEIADQEKSV